MDAKIDELVKLKLMEYSVPKKKCLIAIDFVHFYIV